MDEEIKNACLNAGMDLRNKIVLKINSNIPPPNAPSTVKKKGSSKTLVDNSTMINSVDVQVIEETNGSAEIAVGIFDEGVAQYAIANEYGAVINRTSTNAFSDNPDEMHQGFTSYQIVIPERSFIRSSYDENIDQIVNNLTSDIGEIFARKFKEK
jgi:hypothetical protein